MKHTSIQARAVAAKAAAERLGEALPPPPDAPPRHSKDDPKARNAKVQIKREGKGRRLLWRKW
jgi:hypothetical protein